MAEAECCNVEIRLFGAINFFSNDIFFSYFYSRGGIPSRIPETVTDRAYNKPLTLLLDMSVITDNSMGSFKNFSGERIENRFSFSG